LAFIRGLQLGESDAVFFYFAGHGFSRSGRDYLACSDTSLADLDSAISPAEIVSASLSSGAGTCVLVLDACRSWAEKDVGLFGEATLELARNHGLIAFVGCSPGERCQEDFELAHGVFTYSLLNAISDQEPCTVPDIQQSVVRQVERICSAKRVCAQRPRTCVGPLRNAVVDLFTGEFVKPRREHERDCLLIVGPSNSGKTTLGQRIAQEFGMLHLEMSTFALRRYWRHRKQTRFAGSIQDFMEQVVWDCERKDTIAHDLVEADPGSDRVVISGPRTVEEVELLRKVEWNCKTIFLYSDDQTRFDRYCASGENKLSGLGYRGFVSQDLREYGWGLAKTATMKNVDIFINDCSMETLLKRVESKLSLRTSHGSAREPHPS
jgi:adenylate kinase family enzyme